MFSFEERQVLCDRVTRLEPSCLAEVVKIVFGYTTSLVNGEEFTVDFARLGDTTCSMLCEFLSQQEVEARPVKRRKKSPTRVKGASVLATRGNLLLLLRDDDMSLEWTAATEEPRVAQRSPSARDCAHTLKWLIELDVAAPFAKQLGILARKNYTDAATFVDDVRGIYQNALLYSAMHRAAQVFIAAFEGKWAKLNDAPFGTWLHIKLPKPPPASLGLGPAVGKRVETLANGRWFAGKVVREKQKRFLVEYDDGHSEWIDLATKFKYLDNDNSISVQKLGILVWGKTGKHPWWPAELCIPAADDLLDAVPPDDNQGPVQFVFYFGETQYDILPVKDVVPFSARPRPKSTSPPDLLDAYKEACLRRIDLDELATEEEEED